MEKYWKIKEIRDFFCSWKGKEREVFLWERKKKRKKKDLVLKKQGLKIDYIWSLSERSEDKNSCPGEDKEDLLKHSALWTYYNVMK